MRLPRARTVLPALGYALVTGALVASVSVLAHRAIDGYERERRALQVQMPEPTPTLSGVEFVVEDGGYPVSPVLHMFDETRRPIDGSIVAQGRGFAREIIGRFEVAAEACR